MNYKKVYNNIVRQSLSKNRVKGDLYENHHIVPKCMGGLDDKCNMVLLTPREHFVCHHLLCKIYGDDKLKYAFWMMYTMKDSLNRDYKITSIMYQILRRQHRLIKKPEGFQVGKNNSNYGTFWATNGTDSIRLKKDEMIPEGFSKGRYITGKKEQGCQYCDVKYKPINQEVYCSVLCAIKCRGGILIEQYEEIYKAYIKYGSFNKALKVYNITYNGTRCKRFHEIRKMYGDSKYSDQTMEESAEAVGN